MERWAPRREDVLAEIAAEILHNYGTGRRMVAIDGIDGAGKTRFADDLAAQLRELGHAAARVSIDDFRRPPEERHAQGRESASGYFEDFFDYAAFRSAVVEPFRAGGPFRPSVPDHSTNTPAQPEPIVAGPDTIMIVDGIFVHRPELVDLWSYSVWLEVPREVGEARILERDGMLGPVERYRSGQELYKTRVQPSAKATVILDNTDPRHPRRIFADSC
jgi:uridine kinase